MKGKIVRIKMKSIKLRFIQLVPSLHSKIYMQVIGDSSQNCRNPK